MMLSVAERDRMDAIDIVTELETVRGHLALAKDALFALHPTEVDRALDPNSVLVVDDDEAFAKAALRRLEMVGLRGYYEPDPTFAAKAFNLIRPRTVFMDLMMPQRQGTLVVAELKQIEPQSVVVLVTGFLNEQTAFDGAYWGADFVVEKGDMGPLVQIAQGKPPQANVITTGFDTDDQARRKHARRALDRFGSQPKAAEALGIDVRTLQRRLGLED